MDASSVSHCRMLTVLSFETKRIVIGVVVAAAVAIAAVAVAAWCVVVVVLSPPNSNDLVAAMRVSKLAGGNSVSSSLRLMLLFFEWLFEVRCMIRSWSHAVMMVEAAAS